MRGDDDPRPPWERHPGLVRTRRALVRHRRLAAGVLLAVAAGTTAQAAVADPPDGVPVVVAARDLATGDVLGTGDLAVAEMAPAAVPDGTDRDVAELVGAVLAAPLRRGEPVTDVRVRGRGVLATAPEGTVATGVHLGDGGAATLLAPGDRVDLLAPGPPEAGAVAAEVVAAGAVVLDVPRGGSGLLDGPAPPAVVVLALRPDEARRVVGAQSVVPLGVVLLPEGRRLP